MNAALVQQPMAWAEDRATVGTDPSADPGAKTEGRAAETVARLSAFGIGTNAINPSRRSRENNTQRPGDVLPELHNPERQKIHFTLNQYRLHPVSSRA
jgi:hypothetical protein